MNSIVSGIYERRKTFIRGFFTRLGFRGLDAEIRTRLTLCYLSWEPSLYAREPETRRFKLVKALTELLTKK